MSSSPQKEQQDSERYEALEQLEDWLEVPVMVLGVIWLALLVVELIWGLNAFLNTLVYIIWGVFIVDFVLRFILAPQKIDYLKSNWLTALSLFIPALRIGRLVRVLRLYRVAQATRGLRLVKMISSLNRGMRILRNTMRRRGFGYVMLLTLAVTLVGAAGMFTFEGPEAARAGQDGLAGFNTYGESLWWTSMVMTTMGSDVWPRTTEGRLLTLLLSIYAFAVFGYVTATLATFFLGTDRAQPATEPDDAALVSTGGAAAPLPPLENLAGEIAGLRSEIQELRAALANNNNRPPDRPA